MNYALGIDLGTTFSVCAVVDEKGEVRVVNNSEGRTTTPSVIYFGEEGILVGNEAKEYQAMGEECTASFFKRNMGDKYFKLVFHNKEYTAEDLSTLIIKKLKADAEKQLCTKINNAVITVPAYFNNFQREATIEAARRAGLNVLRIINEPTSAAIAYGLKDIKENKDILVYDLGGGTFDVSLVHISPTTIEVIATDGDHELGGKDWDDRIAVFVGEKFSEGYGFSPLDEITAYNDLLVKCENVKKHLSTREASIISITYEGKKGSYEITKSIFEQITRDLMERTQRLTEQVLKDSGYSFKQIDGVLLVGGSTKMPMVKEYIYKMSGKEPMNGVNVDEAVAIGAAIQASIDLSNKSKTGLTLPKVKKMQDVISHSLGMIAVNEDGSKYINSIIIPKNKKIPCIEKRPFQIRTVADKDNFVEVYMLQGESDNPKQCTILGKYIFNEIKHVANKATVLDIEYKYDINGMVTVAAYQRGTNKNLPLVIEKVDDELEWLNDPPVKENIVAQDRKAVILAIDLSGSMCGNPLREAQKAAKKFVEEMDLTHSSIGIIGFADRVEILQNLSQNAKDINNAIDKLATIDLGAGTSNQPFPTALKMFEGIEDSNFLITLTDGQWYGHNNDNCLEMAKLCQEKNIEIISLGFGAANETFLKEIASSSENALYTEVGNLTTSFSKIAQVLVETEKGKSIRVFE